MFFSRYNGITIVNSQNENPQRIWNIQNKCDFHEHTKIDHIGQLTTPTSQSTH